MRSLNNYLTEYSKSHQNVINIKIHTICVPAIMWSLLGFLSTFVIYAEVNAAHLLALISLIFYTTFKNIKLLMTMLIVLALCLFSFEYIIELRIFTGVVFVLAWIGQFYGHKVEGQKPSFFEDLLFLLIGPLWVFKKFAPKLIGV